MLDNTLYNAIITAIVSAFITNVCLWWHKKADYKRDYYKKIIDKRMNAYEKLQDYIGYIAISRSIKNPEKNEGIYDGVKMYDCFLKPESLHEASEATLKILNFAPWLADDIANSLYEINNILCLAQEVIGYPSEKNLAYYNLELSILANEFWYLNIGEQVYNDMYNNITIIRKGLLRDITRLDDVEDFLKR